MKHVFNDGGRAAAGLKGTARDCVVRAVAIATQQPYAEVYDALHDGCRTERLSRTSTRRLTPNAGVRVQRLWFKRHMVQLGWTWTATMGIGTGCTVHLTDGELPMGRLIVSVSKHYTAVIDGVIHDTFNPERNVHSFRQFPGWQTADLKPGEHRNENGIHSVQRRCVYGYWQKALA